MFLADKYSYIEIFMLLVNITIVIKSLEEWFSRKHKTFIRQPYSLAAIHTNICVKGCSVYIGYSVRATSWL